MKRKLLLLSAVLLVLPLFLVSCSEESKVKDVAVQSAQDKLRQEARSEAGQAFSGKEDFKNIYVELIQKKSEFEVSRVDVHGDSAQATVEVKTIPPSARQVLLDIVGKLNPKQENAFNMTDALNLIYQQLGLKPGSLASRVYQFELHHGDGWKVTSSK